MTRAGDTVLIGRTEYVVVFDGRQELLKDRPAGLERGQSPIARLAESPIVFRRATRRYVRASAAGALSTT
ncbi:MAG TPA: hypothetical protein VF188_00090 [Longimicrobiales bacterium]